MLVGSGTSSHNLNMQKINKSVKTGTSTRSNLLLTFKINIVIDRNNIMLKFAPNIGKQYMSTKTLTMNKAIFFDITEYSIFSDLFIPILLSATLSSATFIVILFFIVKKAVAAIPINKILGNSID